MKLMLALLAVLLHFHAYASGMTYMIIQNGNAKSQNPTEFANAVKADGFVLLRSYYFDGPTIRVCKGDKGEDVVVHNSACAIKKTKRLPFFSFSWSGVEHSFKSIGPGVTLQEYLDKRFGTGAVELAGISPRTGGIEDSIFVYYTIKDSK